MALDALARRKKIAESEEYVFTHARAGGFVRRHLFRRDHFLPLLKAAKVPVVRVHDLRHSFASLLLARGVPVKIAAEVLGHASPAITQKTYQHAAAELQQIAIAEVDAALRPM